ncbi:methyltransferase [Nocardia terpenica]|uniref:Methyltransferase n=1 Tax=Nocardia terpenica TaxID=455432 RepID=A0A6G9Z965_9NOCA|nr:methyltransferase [Nocardia terpenica]QIS22149.1 methyltransferase [Nocardia terpenica]
MKNKSVNFDSIISFENATKMRHLLYGRLLSQAVVVAAELEIPKLLTNSAMTVAEISEHTKSDPYALKHLLRSLGVFGIFQEDELGYFSLTPLGTMLCPDTPGTALYTALLVGGEVGNAWDSLSQTVRTRQPAFNYVHGTDFFSYMEADHSFREVFDASQNAGIHFELEALLASIDFGEFNSIVDVGGGDGRLLEAILCGYPDVTGILFDLDSVVSSARNRLLESPVSNRIEFISGDFGESIPDGGNLYLLRHIVHDWPDARCVDILRRCGEAMAPDGRILIIDRIADSQSGDNQMTALMTLYMLTVMEGRERTSEEFAELIHIAGLTVENILPLAGDTTAIIARPHTR